MTLKEKLEQQLIEKLKLFKDPETGLWNCKGTVNLMNCNLSRLPFKFGKVMGNFLCDSNRLTTLESAPEYVHKTFGCTSNQLTNLDYCPKFIGGDFYCSKNKLTSLVGCPKIIKGHFMCYDNKLTDLVGGPIQTNSYDCCTNNLKTINGYPKQVNGNFWCGGPTKIEKPLDLDCSNFVFWKQ